MDNKHKLDAPNNESLRSIEQVSDHSELSTLYRSAGKQWTGEVVSHEERERRLQHEQDTRTFGIRKQFWTVGLLAPLPLVLLSLILGAAFTIVNENNVAYYVIPMLIVSGIWAALSFNIIRRIFELFYQHGLRAGPFLIVLLTFLGLSIQIIYVLTMPLHGQQLLSSVMMICAIELLWSIIITYALLLIWTTPTISGGVKVAIIGLIGLFLLMAAVAVTFF